MLRKEPGVLLTAIRPRVRLRQHRGWLVGNLPQSRVRLTADFEVAHWLRCLVHASVSHGFSVAAIFSDLGSSLQFAVFAPLSFVVLSALCGAFCSGTVLVANVARFPLIVSVLLEHCSRQALPLLAVLLCLLRLGTTHMPYAAC